MDINMQNAKLELIQWLTTLEDSEIIKRILELRKHETDDFWDELNTTTKKEIELADEEIKQGKTVDYDKFIAKYR